MKTEALNCRCCGGVMNVKSALCVCEFCGATNFISPTAEKYIIQLNRANKLRQEKEYDNAIRIYDSILSENVPTADILWLRTLCEYGIEYVPDPISSKYFPTLHRIKDESILNYHSYQEALNLCDDETKEVITKEATEINRIQSEYLEIAKNEAPYDVFICYKETDEDTKETTEDVAYCNQLYDFLCRMGYKVFYARVTLADKLSIDYEPYIFAALKSAKVMAVIGSKSEYFTATWVKNEWSRFLKLMESDSKKQIFFACDDPNELPRAFSLKQAQLLSSQNAMENLAKNINNYLTNILKEKKNGKVGAKTVNFKTDSPQAMYEDALDKAKNGNYAAVLSILSDLIEVYPGMPEAYWLRMAAKLRHNTENIQYCKKDLTLDPDFEKAVSIANDTLKKEYMETKDKCLENIRLQNEFNEVMDRFADDYRTELKRNNFLSKKERIVKELEDIEADINKPITSKRKKEELGKQRDFKLSELNNLYKKVLQDFASKGIQKYREFISENGISEKTEIVMESANYSAIRSEIVNENKELIKRFSPADEVFPDGPERKVKKELLDPFDDPIYDAFDRADPNATIFDLLDNIHLQ